MIQLLLHGSWPLLDDFLEFLQVCYLYSCYPTVSKNRQTDPWETDSTLCNLSLLLFVLILYMYVTNFNTWKSICCKCSRSCNLLLAGNCCFWEFLSAAGVICSYLIWKQFFIRLIMFQYLHSICVFFSRAHLIWSPALLCVLHSHLSFLWLVQMYFFPSLILAL